MKPFLLLVLILLQITYQGVVFHDFSEHFANFLAWKSHKNEPIGKGTQKLQNFIKFIDEVGKFPQKIQAANLTHKRPSLWALSNEPILKTSVGLVTIVDKIAVLPEDWRLLTYQEAIPIYQQIKGLLSNEWAIVGLENGRVHGSGYQYKLETKDGSECGQKFIIKDESDV